MKLERRTVLKTFMLGTVALGVPSVLSSCASKRSDEAANLILGGGRFQDLDTGETRHVFSIVDLDEKRTTLIDVDFLPHGIHLHEETPNRLAVFEKKGPNAVEIDLGARRVTRKIETVPGRYFYGHGAYSVDAQHLFCTETELSTLEGMIAIRDAQTHAYLGEFPSYGKEPHECKLIESGRTMVVTNGGGSNLDHAPSVTYIDVASQKLLERVELTNHRINTGHAAIGADGALVVVSAPRRGLATTEPGGVSIRPKGRAMQTLADPAEVASRMQGEALSVAVHEPTRVAAVTHPDGGMVTFWSTEDRRLIKVVDLPHPRGVTLTRDDRFFVVSYGSEASLLRIAVEDLQQVADSIVPDTLISGSHIYNWSRGLTEILAPRG